MKTARLCLMIVLALLLPLRSAIAGSMAVSVQHDAPPACHEMSGETTAAHHDAGRMTGCNLCCAFCAMTPMPVELTVLPMPSSYAQVAYPAIDAPPASHVTDGPERPPRGC